MHALVQQLIVDWPIEAWSKTRVLIAVSGGADSIALLLALRESAPDPTLLCAAHFNHGWRGEESDRDADFVRQVCQREGVELTVENSTGVDTTRSEANARQARYAFLARAAYQTGSRYVTTAHTRSDRAETILHNLFRGTGLAGVVGPRRSRPFDAELVLARPLLSCSRSQVLDYLSAKEQAYRVDASNSDQQYRRNFLRHTVLPSITEHYGESVEQSLTNFSEIVAEAQALIGELASDYVEQAQHVINQDVVSTSGFTLPTTSTLPVRWPILQAALVRCWQESNWPLQGLTREHWQQVRQILNCEDTTQAALFQLPGNVTVSRNHNRIQFSRG